MPQRMSMAWRPCCWLCTLLFAALLLARSPPPPTVLPTTFGSELAVDDAVIPRAFGGGNSGGGKSSGAITSGVQAGLPGPGTNLVTSPSAREERKEAAPEAAPAAAAECRRQVQKVVTVTDQPPSFSFPAYRTCYQPTTQVLLAAGYIYTRGYDATIVSRLSDPGALRQPYRVGAAYMDRLPGSSAIGGSKFEQYSLKQQWARRHGCNLSTIPLFPEQYLITEPQQCRTFFEHAAHEGPRTWFLKQASGEYKFLHATHGLTLIRSTNTSAMVALRQRFSFACDDRGTASVHTNQFIVQTEVKPLLLNNRKFDYRAFLLVARTEPLFAFYHDGFLRVASEDYGVVGDSGYRAIVTNAEFGKNLKSISHDDHYWSLQRLQAYLDTNAPKSAAGFVERMRLRMQTSMLFSLLAGREKLGGSHGAFQVPDRPHPHPLNSVCRPPPTFILLGAAISPTICFVAGFWTMPWRATYVRLLSTVHVCA